MLGGALADCSHSVEQFTALRGLSRPRSPRRRERERERERETERERERERERRERQGTARLIWILQYEYKV